MARAADADDYRNQLRALLANDDRKASAAKLKALADEPRAAELPPATAVLLGTALRAPGKRRPRSACSDGPSDRIPTTSGSTSPWPRPSVGRPGADEVVRYYTAARAIRPETGHRLAHLLYLIARSAESEAIFRDLIRRRPDIPEHLACFGMILTDSAATPRPASSWTAPSRCPAAALKRRARRT